MAKTVESAEDFADEGVVLRSFVGPDALGWHGIVAAASTRSILTLYTSTDATKNAFSRAVCHQHRAAVKPSLAFYDWLAMTTNWQLRGEITLTDAEMTSVLGDLQLSIESLSVWAGAPSTRTPLHRDDVDTLIMQIAGTKRCYLCTSQTIEDAVTADRLPKSVLNGTTEDFCVHGSLDQVHGSGNNVVLLNPGDVLFLPKGLYHDIESVDASLSLTIRWSNDRSSSLLGAAAAAPETLSDDDDGDHAQRQLHRFLWRLALKKAAQDGRLSEEGRQSSSSSSL